MFKLRCEWGFRFARSRMCIWLPTSYCCAPSVVALIKETLGLRVCYFVFMFEYPTGLKKLFLYLQQYILQIRDGKKLPSSVITFVSEMESL